MAKKRIPRDTVIAMRKQYEAGYSIDEIRAAYSYSRQSVSDLAHHRTHKHVLSGMGVTRYRYPTRITVRPWATQAIDSIDHV